jgi:hypothetical protein
MQELRREQHEKVVLDTGSGGKWGDTGKPAGAKTSSDAASAKKE